MKKLLLAVVSLGLFGSYRLPATETENLDIRVLPVPGKVTIDGKADDWDLSGGTFGCGDVENARDKFAVWFHLMYNAENLYVLVRWVDETPLNNAGSTKGDFGWNGDCLQVRFITAPKSPVQRVTHWTCWQGQDGANIMGVHWGEFGKKDDYARDLKDARTEGGKQALLANPDGRGYAQELAIPWKLLTADGQPLRKGDQFGVTIEPNFTVGINGRLSIKDIFKKGVTPDRVFTFRATACWGAATLEPKGNVTPQLVRLTDGREFAVRLDNGATVVDWTGLIRTKDLVGFASIEFTMPFDGYISLHIRNSDGVVVRQLLNAAFYAKGPHTVKWDGLTTPNWRKPGDPVPAGNYTWRALVHPGIGLKLRGWACNGGSSPWDYPATGNWGGDHGVPASCAADATKVYLGWTGAEAGKALLACDLEGNVKWNNTHGGIAGVDLVAVDGGTVFVARKGRKDADGNVALYRLDAKTGRYTEWAGTASTDLMIPPPTGLAAAHGKVYVSYAESGHISLLDGQEGREVQTISVGSPSGLAVQGDRLVVISNRREVLAVDPVSGKSKEILSGLTNVAALALDQAGNLFVGLREPDHQVKAFSPAGKPLHTIGRQGGRAKLGRWTPDGLFAINSLAVDAAGKLWVMEGDSYPKRVSVWDAATGKFAKEFFGPSTYGALGGAINPRDPDLMVGQGCEWRLDPKTGRAACLGVITRAGMENARFGASAAGRQYLAIASKWRTDPGPLHIFERLGDADYKLRATVFYADDAGQELPDKASKATQTGYWADANGDGDRQPNEIKLYKGVTVLSAWYLAFTEDMTFYTAKGAFKVAGFTACGAPQYNLDQPFQFAGQGFGSPDGRLAITLGSNNKELHWVTCTEVATGKTRWTYPDNFTGVHGSHRAPPPEPGMIRGSFGPCGSAQLPAPVGDIWVLTSNVGEWHILNGDGFYLTKLFQGDQMKVQWPDKATPGAGLDNCPPGMGGEDFGGSIAATADGRLFLQAGKTAFWNVEVVGLDQVRTLPGGQVTIAEKDLPLAVRYQGEFTQATIGTGRITAPKLTPSFTGKLEKDFAGAELIAFQKQDDGAVRATAAWDGEHLYLGWDVRDKTPWVNGATDPVMLYLGGDTVDFQFGADPAADKNRREAVLGDWRLSIGNFQGKPTAVLYRKAAKQKHPRVFSSGVVKEYVMESVQILADAKITVTPGPKGYVVEAAIPLARLDIQPAAGRAYRGDFGVTHGDLAGQRTRLRTYWNNQQTGIVDDAVFELQLEPKNWGELTFGE